MRGFSGFIFIFLSTFGSFGQGAKDKKFQAGIVTSIGLNTQKMGTKYVTANGHGSDFTIGINTHFQLKDAIAFNTGLEFDFETIQYKMATQTPTFYRFSDTEILKYGSPVSSSDQVFTLIKRKEQPLYLSIPTMMLFRTDFIGNVRYFAKFGLRHSFLLKNEINDSGFSGSTASSNNQMTSKGDLFFYKGTIGLSAGTEWNFIGSTSLVAELGYYYGFTPLHNTNKEKNMTLYTLDETNHVHPFSNKATQRQLMLKVAVLF
jgi:hypothetical protein